MKICVRKIELRGWDFVNYGSTTCEKIQVVKAQYKIAVDGYKKALKLLESDCDFNDPDQLKLLVNACHNCHDTLFSAFEVSLKVLIGDSTSCDSTKKFPTLKDLACELAKIAPLSDPRKLQGVDYSLVDSIDLNRIITTKDCRNDLTHNGIIREFRHYSRLFGSLEKLIIMLDSEFRALSSNFEGPSNRDIFDNFYNTIEKFEASYCAYVLILDSTWDIPNDQMDNLIFLPWDIIIDLDGRGIGENAMQRSRVEKAIINKGLLPISFYARNCDPTVFSSIEAADKIPYLNFSDGGIVLDQNTDPSIAELQANLRKAERSGSGVIAARRNLNEKSVKMRSLHLFVQAYLENKFERCIVVSTAEFMNGIKSVGNIIDMLAEKYNQDIRVVLVQDPCEEYRGMPVWYANDMATKLNCELKDFVIAIDQNRDLLPIDNQRVNKNTDEYCFPMRDGSVGKFQRNFVMKNVEDYFELLHLEVGNEPDENDIEKFYRGHLASWSALRRGCAADIVEDRRKRLEHQIISSFTSSPDVKHAYYIVHEPGFGGTTLGRQIAWNMHKRIPVVRLKHYDKNIVHRINDLYKELKQTPFLILMDANYEIPEESIEAMNQLFTNQITSLPPVVGLFVRRKHFRESTAGNKLLLTTIDQGQQKTVQDKCLEYARKFYSSPEEIQNRITSLHTNITPQDRFPMITNLYIMDRNFLSPEQYVKSFIDLESISDDIKKALLFIALYSYCTGYELPGRFVYFVCNRRSGVVSTHLRLMLAPYEHVLIFVDGLSISARRSKEPDAIKCRHPLFAQELLHCLLGDHWQRELKTLSLDFLEYALQSQMDQSVTLVLSRLFARKDSYKTEEESNGMTRLIREVIDAGLQSDGINLLITVSERIEKYIIEHPELKNDINSDDRHIFGLLARLWAQCARYYRKVNYDQNLMDEFTEKSLSALTANDDAANREFYDLYHMAGCCWQMKLEKCLESLTDESSDDKIDEIRIVLRTATDFFEESIRLGNPDYGLPSLISTQELVVRYLFSHLGFDRNNYRLEKLEAPTYSWLLVVIDEANRLIDSEEDYMLDNDGRDNFYRAANKFRHSCLQDSSLILQSLQNYLDRINAKPGPDHEHSVLRAYTQMIYYTLYKYQKGKNVDFIRLVSNKNDFDRINRYVNEALKHYGDKSHFLYRLWFKLAKLRNASFSEAKQRAQDWKAIPVKPGQKMVWPYYYMYIISLLSGQPKADVEETWNELQRRLRLDRDEGKAELICDYYQSGMDGMGSLVDSVWVSFNEIENNELISWIRGTISHISDNEASGYINSTDVKYLDRKPRLKPEEGHIFFKPASTKLTQRSLKEEVEFKFGFTLKRIQAIDKTVCLANEKDKARALVSKSKSMGFGVENSQIELQHKVTHALMPTTITPSQDVLSKPSHASNKSIEGKEIYLHDEVDAKKNKQCLNNVSEQLSEKVPDQNEVLMETSASEKLENNSLPNLINKEVRFVAKEETSRGGLKGTFEVDGHLCVGTITTGIYKKEIKDLLRNSRIIRAKVIDRSPKGYILKKIL